MAEITWLGDDEDTRRVAPPTPRTPAAPTPKAGSSKIQWLGDEGADVPARSTPAVTSDIPALRERNPKSTVLESIARGTGGAISTSARALRDLGLPTEGIEEWGSELERKYPSSTPDLRSIIADPLQATKETLAEVAPQIGLNLAGAGAGAGVGALVAGPPGAVVGGAIGGFGTSYLQEYGGTRQKQDETGVDDKASAALWAVPGAAVDLFGPEASLPRKLVTGALKKTEGGLGHVVVDVLKKGAYEGGGETAQEAFSRLGAKQSLTENPEDYAVAGLKGTIGGVGISGGEAAYNKVRSGGKSGIDPERQTGDVEVIETTPAPRAKPQVVQPKPVTSRFDIDTVLDMGIAPQETGGNAQQVSPKGAMGKYQLLPSTAWNVAKKLGIPTGSKDEFKARLFSDDAFNRTIARAYLAQLHDKYKGDMVLAVTAYHAGPGNVDNWIKSHGYDRENPQPFLDAIGQQNPISARYPRQVMARLGGDIRTSGGFFDEDFDPDVIEPTAEKPNPLDEIMRQGEMDLAEPMVLKFLRTSVPEAAKPLPSTTRLAKAISEGDEQAQTAIAAERETLNQKLEKLIAEDEALGEGAGLREGTVATAKIRIARQMKVLQARETALDIAVQAAERAARQRSGVTEVAAAPIPAAEDAPPGGVNLITEPTDPNAGYPVGRRAPLPSEVMNPGRGALPTVEAASTRLAEGLRREEMTAQQQAVETAAVTRARETVLDEVLKGKDVRNPRAMMVARLKRAGLDPTLSEQEELAVRSNELVRQSRGENPYEALVEEAQAPEPTGPLRPDLAAEEAARQQRLAEAAATQEALPEQETDFGVPTPEEKAARIAAREAEAKARKPDETTKNISERVNERAERISEANPRQAAWFRRGAQFAEGDTTVPTPTGPRMEKWFNEGRDFAADERARQELEAKRGPAREARPERKLAARKARDEAIAAGKARQAEREAGRQARRAARPERRQQARKARDEAIAAGKARRAARERTDTTTPPKVPTREEGLQARERKLAEQRTARRAANKARKEAAAKVEEKKAEARKKRAEKKQPPAAQAAVAAKPAAKPAAKTVTVGVSAQAEKLAKQRAETAAALVQQQRDIEAREEAEATARQQLARDVDEAVGKDITKWQAQRLNQLTDMKDANGDPVYPIELLQSAFATEKARYEQGGHDPTIGEGETFKEFMARVLAPVRATQANQRVTRRGALGALVGALGLPAVQAEARTPVGDKVSSAFATGKLENVVRAIAETTKNPEYAKVARAMLLGGFADDTEIIMMHMGDAQLAIAGKTDLYTDPAENKVVGKVYIYHTTNGVTGMTEETILHEALHSWVVARYHQLTTYGVASNRPLLKIREQQGDQFIDQFTEVWLGWSKMMQKRYPDLINEKGPIELSEAAARPDEMFVRLFTDPVLQDWLRTHDIKGNKIAPANPASLWSRIMRMIQDLFGVKAKPKVTALSELSDAGWSILKSGTLDEPSLAVAQKIAAYEGMSAQGAAAAHMNLGVTARLGIRGKARLRMAKGMALSGRYTREQITKATGWDFDPDGNWKFEISDRDAVVNSKLDKVKPGEETTLSDILHHPALFNAYPELRTMRITRHPVPGDGRQEIEGVYHEAVPATATEPATAAYINIPPYADPKQYRTTLLHELQHHVQEVEGFPSGGDPSIFTVNQPGGAISKMRKFFEEQAAISTENAKNTVEPDPDEEFIGPPTETSAQYWNRMVDLLNEMEQKHHPYIARTMREMLADDAEIKQLETAIAQAQARVAAGGAPTAAMVRAQKRRDDLQTGINDNIGKIRRAAERFVKLQYHAYAALGGEIEARETEARQDMSADELRASQRGQGAYSPYAINYVARYDAQPRSLGRTIPTALLSNDRAVEVTLGEMYQRLPPPRPNTAAQRGKRTAVESADKAIRAQVEDKLKKGSLFLAGTKEIIAVGQKYAPSMGQLVELQSRTHALGRDFELRLLEIKDAYLKVPRQFKGSGRGSINELAYDMTISGKWGFEPAYHPKGVPEIDPALKARFDAMPKVAQDVIRAQFRYNFDARNNLYKATLGALDAEYDPLIEAAEATGDAAKVKEMEEAKTSAMAHFSRVFDTREGLPYTPLKREGNFIVVGKSPAYIAAEKANDRKALDKMRSDDKHYFVDFTNTIHEAEALHNDVKQQFGSGTEYFERGSDEAEAAFNTDNMHLAFKRMQSAISDKVEEGSRAAKEMHRLATDLYLHSLTEQSARKGELHRERVPAKNPRTGEVPDMMRAFTSRGAATANYIASISNNTDMQRVLRTVKDEINSNTGQKLRDAKRIHNEVIYRYTKNLGKQPTRVVDAIVRGTSIWTLLTLPTYYAQNATQTALITQPLLAAKFGYFPSAAALVRGYNDFLAMTKNTGLLDRVDFKKAPADVRDAVDYLAKHGHLDAGYSSELGHMELNGNGVLPTSWNKVDRFFRQFPQRVEVMNRTTAGIAAYRLAIAKGMTPTQAQEYAGQVIDDSHGDYSGWNAPRPFHWGSGSFGKITLQFRKFQLIMGQLLVREIGRTFKGATFEEKAQGAAALGFLTSHMLMIGGIRALPGVAMLAIPVSYMLNVMDDDDDEDWKNWRERLRKALGAGKEEDRSWWADFLYKGAPYALGVDTSDRLGMGNVASLAPYSGLEEAFTSQQKFNEVAGKMVLGASGGVVGKAVNGWGYGKENGDWMRFYESIAPSGVAAAMKGYRLKTKGLESKAGVQLVAPEDISFGEALAVALGATPRQLANQAEQASEAYDVGDFYKGKTTQLKNEYIRAMESGSPAAKSKVLDKWEVVQKARERDGLKRQPRSTLTHAPAERRKAERGVIEGVPTTKQNRSFVRRQVGLDETELEDATP
jgi:hypothetical protein